LKTTCWSVWNTTNDPRSKPPTKLIKYLNLLTERRKRQGVFLKNPIATLLSKLSKGNGNKHGKRFDDIGKGIGRIGS
jgi:hypothetical protein